MTIHEPATLLTDYLLTGLGMGLAWHLRRLPESENPATRWWIRSLVVMAISAFIGGSYHGFAPNFPPHVAAIWWRIVLWLICVLGLTMGISLICELVHPDRQSRWKQIMLGKLALSSIAVMTFPLFVVAIIDYGSAMIAWAVASMVFARQWSAWILSAVGLSAVAAWIQQSGFGFSHHFNHNDVFHLIQALAIVGFYRAARLMGRQIV